MFCFTDDYDRAYLKMVKVDTASTCSEAEETQSRYKKPDVPSKHNEMHGLKRTLSCTSEYWKYLISKI